MDTADLAFLPSSGAVHLAHWGVIRASGQDAVKFLQGQLTNDVASMGAGEARLAGFCSAKGRLQASFLMWKREATAEADIFLACSASLLAPTLKRLSMFVLRAKCKLSDASADCPMWGLVGEAVPPDLSPWHAGAGSDGSWALRLPDVAGCSRAVRIGSAPAGIAPMPLDTWRWLEVGSAIPIIEAPTVEQFVPQMLNYELVGGVDFKKGCYPGQEVVARSQYRGTTKRRSFLFDCDAPCSPGQEVFHSESPGQPAGMIVNAAPRPAGSGFHALVEVKLGALSAGSLRLGNADGPVLRPCEMPYPVPRDTTEAA